MTTSTDKLIEALADLLKGDQDNAGHSLTCDWISAFIEEQSPTDAEIAVILAVARTIDPSESFHAAHLRDTMRDCNLI